MTAYAGGLRILEVARLKGRDIDSQLMVLRIELGKGRVDRYLMPSSRLPEIVHTDWPCNRNTRGSRRGFLTSPSTLDDTAGVQAGPEPSWRLSRRTHCATCSVPIFSYWVPKCVPSNCCSATAARHHLPLSEGVHEHGLCNHQPLLSVSSTELRLIHQKNRQRTSVHISEDRATGSSRRVASVRRCVSSSPYGVTQPRPAARHERGV